MKKIDGMFVRFMWSNYKYLQPYHSFSQVRHFTAKEVGDLPDGSHMNLVLMWKTDIMREIADERVIIHKNGGFAPEGHKKGSWHCWKEDPADAGEGFALDFHIENLSLHQMFRLAVLMQFNSIGVYPYWRNPGLHVDMRPDDDGTPQLWMRNGLGQYVGLPNDFLDLLI